ncbi:MAG: hypothetical protein VKK32_01440 [Candidatus Melainabacteria bacterium]|jgi:hypothetical protein|nr:hypothetical protein [Candidatus Melainabacteria bacterium]
MAYQFKLQVPISEELNQKLKNKANEVGFSSVNEIARLLLTNFANGNLSLSFTEKPPKEELTISKELEAVIKKGISDYKKGKTKKLDFSKSIHEQLMED